MPKKPIQNAPQGKEFIFRLPDGKEVGRARNIGELVQMIRDVPLASLLFHAPPGDGKRSHFIPWLRMLGEEEAARKLESSTINEQTVRVTLLRCLK